MFALLVTAACAASLFVKVTRQAMDVVLVAACRAYAAGLSRTITFEETATHFAKNGFVGGSTLG